MKRWTYDELLASDETPRTVERIARLVDRQIQRRVSSGYPSIESVQYDVHDEETHRLVITVEGAMGLLLPIVLEQEPSRTAFAGREGSFLELVEEGLRRVSDDFDGVLRRLAHVRRTARRICAEWQDAGLPVRLLRVGLQPYDHWRGAEEPKFEVEIEGLDDRLRPAAIRMMIDGVDELAAEVAALRPLQARMFEARRRFGAEGADGSIDQLTLTAISTSSTMAEVLRGFRTDDRVRLSDGTLLRMVEGRITSGRGALPGDPLGWEGDTITVDGLDLAAASALAAVGRPAMEILDHPMLAGGMRVLEIWAVEGAEPGVAARVEQQRCYFCADSGELW